ncbi:MarR family winged helix-turn-helix transcriptional regulator [Salegentibacter sediminis]|uniref:MarR family winged helix-turn-helix transcriptional regulator n=1 Tax=Salegentibacter sediminis TaxID=1930251 RepID=UPI0009BEA5E1|nr:MarR family transcriptional regulator [Salegentibacter sediminis]
MSIEETIKTTNKLPESRRLILNILVTANHINDRIGEALKDFDLSIPQFNVLRILRGQKGKPANLSTIQERMVSRMSNTTRLVDKLILKGYVERVICEKNRRKVEISITKKGLEFLQEVDPVIDHIESEIASRINSEEIELINDSLNELRG